MNAALAAEGIFPRQSRFFSTHFSPGAFLDLVKKEVAFQRPRASASGFLGLLTLHPFLHAMGQLFDLIRLLNHIHRKRILGRFTHLLL